MFISLGSFLGRSKQRLGLGIRITKKNVWWMLLFAMFYGIFMMAWYMILICAWLVYAVFYGLYALIRSLTGQSRQPQAAARYVPVNTASPVLPANAVTQKGHSVVAFPDNFTVVDVETTGLTPEQDDIIEVAALRVRNNEVVDTFSSLVQLQTHTFLDKAVIDMTGITFATLSTAPPAAQVFPAVRNFIGADIVVGHNVCFDVDFLHDKFMRTMRVPFPNNYVDTLDISRKVFPELRRHRLTDMAAKIGYTPEASHRALADCRTTLACYYALRRRVWQTVGIDEFVDRCAKSKSYTVPRDKVDLRLITPRTDTFDESHPLFGKRCVFTGTLERMARIEAAQAVVDLGGFCDNNVTKKTNLLIVGRAVTDGKTGKQKKAEEYKQQGVEIEIITENTFYDMLKSELQM